MERIAAFGPKHGSILSFRSRANLVSQRKLYSFPQKSLSGEHAKLVRMKATRATATLSHDDQESNRKFKKLPSSGWGHHFLSAQIDVSVSL